MPYHYLVASLPLLSFGEPPPFSSREFLARCAGVLDADHLEALEALFAGRSLGGGAAAEDWSARETQLRNAVARARAGRLGVDSRGFERDHRGYDVLLGQAVANALGKTPLESERGLDRERWRIAEELTFRDPFGFGAVLGFALKLRITERWAGLSDEAGMRSFETLLDRMTKVPEPIPVAEVAPSPAPGHQLVVVGES